MSSAVIAVIASGVSERDSCLFLAVTITSSSIASSSCEYAVEIWVVAANATLTAKAIGLCLMKRISDSPV